MSEETGVLERALDKEEPVPAKRAMVVQAPEQEERAMRTETPVTTKRAKAYQIPRGQERAEKARGNREVTASHCQGVIRRERASRAYQGIRDPQASRRP